MRQRWIQSSIAILVGLSALLFGALRYAGNLAPVRVRSGAARSSPLPTQSSFRVEELLAPLTASSIGNQRSPMVGTGLPPAALSSDQKPELKVRNLYGGFPLNFEANQGQMDARVKFLSRGRGYTMFLTSNEAVLALQSRQSSVVSRQLQKTTDTGLRARDALFSSLLPTPYSLPPPRQSLRPNPEPLIPSVLRLKLVGANPAAKVKGLEELPGKSNYFIGNDPKKWRTNVPNYAKVQYQGVYPGVDLGYYGNQRQLEYDFVVAPGADPNVIRLA
jgi:hypothetical protein